MVGKATTATRAYSLDFKYQFATDHTKVPSLLPQLGLRQPEVVPFVVELLASLFACELPVDDDVVAIHCSVPCLRFAAQISERWNSAQPQALTAEEADLDPGLV
jgi:hypothetical protein